MTIEIDQNEMNGEDSLQIDSSSHLAISSDTNRMINVRKMGGNVAEIVLKTAANSSRGDNDAEKEGHKMDIFKQSEAFSPKNAIDGKYRDVCMCICLYMCSYIVVSLLTMM
jgi:hypothetical protein